MIHWWVRYSCFKFCLKFFTDRRWLVSDWYVLKEKSELYLIMVDYIKQLNKYLRSSEELFLCLILKKALVPCIGKYFMGWKPPQFVLLTWEGVFRSMNSRKLCMSEPCLCYILLGATSTVFLKIFFVILEVARPVHSVPVLMFSAVWFV